MADQDNIRLMADQLKEDRKETIERLKEISRTNSDLAKKSSDPKERKDALKAANKASKEAIVFTPDTVA